VTLAAAILLPRTGNSESPSTVVDPGKPVVVFAAASLKTALDAVAAAWKTHNGKTATLVYSSSDVLAKQIEHGASADVFISADPRGMDDLEKAKRLRGGTRRNFLRDKLVLIEPSGSGGKIEIAKGFDLSGAAGDGKIAVCALDSCPEGMSAKESLEALGIFSSVEPKLVQTGNIQSTLTLVSRGEAKFGIVYATDARTDPAVKTAGTFPASSHGPLAYAGALLEASVNPDAADFLSYLRSQAATKIFTGQGFEIWSK
jgi:molybdate transport system substrate-binding protein